MRFESRSEEKNPKNIGIFEEFLSQQLAKYHDGFGIFKRNVVSVTE